MEPQPPQEVLGWLSAWLVSLGAVCRGDWFGGVIIARVTAPPSQGITTLPMNGTSTPVNTSASSTGGNDSSWRPNTVSSASTIRNATSHAASVVITRVNHRRPWAGTSRSTLICESFPLPARRAARQR